MREHTDGEFPFANDFNAVVRDALAGSTLVESGCTVSDGGTNDLSLDVASGEVVVNSTDASVSSQSVTLGSANADNPRYDLVVADDTGAASVVAGTASSTPQAPSIPSDSVLLAVVEVTAGASGVTDADIYDARAVLSGIPNDVVTQGPGSGLDADTIDGMDASRAAGEVQQDLSGNIYVETTVSQSPGIQLGAMRSHGGNADPSTNWTTTMTGIAASSVYFTVSATDGYGDTGWKVHVKNALKISGATVSSSSASTAVRSETTTATIDYSGSIGVSDSVTLQATISHDNPYAINDYGISAMLSAPTTGSTSTARSANTMLSPVWVTGPGVPANGSWSLSRSLNGSSIWSGYFAGQLTPTDDLTLQADWSNVTTSTTVDDWKLNEGSYVL